MLTLYFAPGSSSMAAHIALHEVGAAFESRPVLLGSNGTRAPEFLAINPRGKVPTLVVDGHALTEVAGILFYLARAYPAAKLLPEGDPLQEAEVVSWMSYLASGVHPARSQGLEYAQGIWAQTEQRLGGRDWAVGDRYSIADIHLFRLFWRFGSSLKPDPAAFPGLTRHHDRIIRRPAVAKTIEIEKAIGYALPA